MVNCNASFQTKRLSSLHEEYVNSEFYKKIEFEDFVKMHTMLGIEMHLYSISHFGVGSDKKFKDSK